MNLAAGKLIPLRVSWVSSYYPFRTTLIPEGAAMVKLGVNRWALHDDDRDFDTTPSNGKGPQLSFDIYDTAGCSCEQIVAAQHLGNGHMKFGCSTGAMKNWIEALSQP